jgi:flagellar biosynthesis protein FliR
MDDLPALLHALPTLGFGFMLVVARVGTTLLTGPGLGETEIPATVRIALAVVLSALVYPLVQTHLPPLPEAVPELIGLLGLEIIVGAWLGFMTRVLVMALAIAGDIMSFMIGLSSVLQIDPSLGVQVPALQRMMALMAIALLFVSGLYVLPIEAVVGSYAVIRPGSAFDAGGAAQLVTRAVADSFGLALRLAAPFVITCLVWQTALGFISRLVPNIQVHVVSAPAQILGGLMLLSVAIAIVLENWSAGMQQAFSLLPGL